MICVARLKISFVCDERQPDRTSELNFVHSDLASVPADTLLISVDICVTVFCLSFYLLELMRFNIASDGLKA